MLLLFSEKKMSENPLKSLYRKKSVFISLPSDGKYYKEPPKLSIDEELGVMPMTASDDIMLKSPDALFNGEALINMLHSCVPDIGDPNEIPVCDLDLILMAIKVATNGEMLEIISTCPACKKEENYEISLPALMSTSKKISTDNIVEIEDNVKVHVRPYSLRSQIKGQVQKFHNYRMQMMLNDKMPNSEKAKMFDEALIAASAISVQIVADNVLKVELPGEEGTVVVDNPKHIYEWVENMENKVYEKVIDRIRSLSDSNIDMKINLKCPSCSNEYSNDLELDPVSFFI